MKKIVVRSAREEMCERMEELQACVEHAGRCMDRSGMLLKEDLPLKWARMVKCIRQLGMEDVAGATDGRDSMARAREMLQMQRFMSEYILLGANCIGALTNASQAYYTAEDRGYENVELREMRDRHEESFGEWVEEMGMEVRWDVTDAVCRAGYVCHQMYLALVCQCRLVEQIYEEGLAELQCLQASRKDMLACLISGFRGYVAREHRRIEKQLHHETSRFRTCRTAKMTRDAWGRLSDAEDDAVQAAWEERLYDDETDFDYIPEDVRQLMEEERHLLKCIADNSVDEEEFNFKDAILNNGLLTVLTEHNLDYFYERVHRRNLIQQGMFPDMEERYDAFLHGGQMGHEPEHDGTDSRADELANRPGELLTPRAMTIWKKAEERGWVDANLHLLISIPRGAILASVIATILDLQPRWTPFERLWSIDDLACKFSKAQYCEYFSKLYKEMSNALS